MWLEHLRERALRHPEKTAVVSGQSHLTYEQLHEQALAFGARLRAVGVREGDFVCVLLPSGIDFVVAFFAVAATGGVAVTLDPDLSASEQSRRLEGLQLGAVVTNSSLEGRAPSGSPAVLAGSDDDGTRLEPAASFGGPVLSQFSTGSTGLSKRVVRTQENLMREYRHLADSLALREDDAVVAVVPFHHAHGFGNALMLAIGSGLKLVVPEAPLDSNGRELPLRFWRSDLLACMAAEGVTVLPAVPFIFDLLAASPRQSNEPRLRICISAGSGINENTYRGFRERFGAPIRQLYGCTEAGSVTLNTSDEIDRDWQSVGWPLPGVELRLEGEDGEVAFRSGAMCQGYHGPAVDDGDAFRDGWFRPGDLGRFDDAGMLHIVGRKRSFINTGGYKVDPGEVERVLLAHSGVAEAVVFGVSHPVLDEVVKAVVVRRPGAVINEEELSQLCRQQLSPQKLPRHLEVRASIPRSPLGKVLIRELI